MSVMNMHNVKTPLVVTIVYVTAVSAGMDLIALVRHLSNACLHIFAFHVLCNF